nr:endonuclease/exonuclease/phosphatase family protein [Nocardioides sp. IC4_145]
MLDWTTRGYGPRVPRARTAGPTPPGARSLAASLAAALVLTLAAGLLPGAAAASAGPPAGTDARRSAVFGFKIATFNVLGSQHTRGRGGFAPGTQRARWTAGAISQRGIDVIGLQEVQRDQLRVLRNRLPGHRFWPGRSLGDRGVRLQIAFRAKRFRLVDHGGMMTTFDRQTRPIPWVELRDRRTGRSFYVVDVHNSPRRMERERDRATRKQVRLVQKLRARGRPVFVTADANERREFYCRMTRRTDLRSASGGSTRGRTCVPPEGRLRIDWILGGGPRVLFSGYREDRGYRVRRSSDHALLQARVRVRAPRRG